MARHDQNRTGRMTDNVFGGATQQHVLQSGGAVGGGNDYVNAFTLGACTDFQNDLQRSSVDSGSLR